MSDKPVFVARERELAQLNSYLDLAIKGDGQVCFVTGEAGIGKTALVSEFIRNAQETHPDLVVVFGQCNAQTGIGDPYLPFREILQQLTGNVDDRLARGTITEENASRLGDLLSLSGRAIVEVGPDLIGLFVPGAGLVARLAAFAFDEAEWGKKLQQIVDRKRQWKTPISQDIDQNHIFEQYANVLGRVIEKVPLVLFLDDLQWTDVASAELLFYLGRKFNQNRLLIVGTYRPEEIMLGRRSTSTGAIERHPLEQPLNEFKRYWGDIFIELGQTGEEEQRRFVDVFIDTEPNNLSPGFRQALWEHTDGHPLFTIELLRDMQERGDLVRDEQGRWIEGATLNWDDLPARVEGVIEERIGRLSDELRQTLTVGSVEGERFTAEVIARVQDTGIRNLLQYLCRELERRHRLVQEQGIRQLNGQKLSLFQFSHNLFQVYLYNELSQSERRYLHEDVGNILEALYGDQTDEIALQLARHFEEAGDEKKACHYLYQAGRQAAERFANKEALELLSHALELTSDGMPEERYVILLARERVNDLQGDRNAQKGDLAPLEELANTLDDDQRRTEVNLCMAQFNRVIGELDEAVVRAEVAIKLAQRAQDVILEATGYLELGKAYQDQANYEQAQPQFERALSLTRSHLQEPDSITGEENVKSYDLRLLEANSLHGLCLVISNLGQVDEEVKHLQQVRSIYKELGHRRGETKVLNDLANYESDQGEYEQARTYYMEALTISREVGDRHSEGGILSNLGTLHADEGDLEGAMRYHLEALSIRREIQDLRGQAISLGNLGTITGRQNDHTGARRYFEESLAIFQEIGDRWGEAITLSNLGSVHLYLGNYDDAIDMIEQGRVIYNEIGFKRGAAGAESTLGLLYQLKNEFEISRVHCLRALDVLDELGMFKSRFRVLIHLGDALVGINDFDGAIDAYNQSLDMLDDGTIEHQAVEPLAGLARVALAQNNPMKALAYVKEFMPLLDTADDPYQEYLTCYHVLQANNDPRADEILNTAYRLLQENASSLSDEESRTSFLENVKVNREIVALWEQRKKY
jgi:tetratricopeptide (TPR) repeat protein